LPKEGKTNPDPVPVVGTGDVADLLVAGYKNCVPAYEHTTITNLAEANCINGLVPDGGVSYAGNVIDVVHFWCQICTNQLAGGVHKATINIQSMDIESPPTGGHGINDPSNLLYGEVHWNVQTTVGAFTPYDPSIVGATNLKLYNIQFPAVALSAVAGALTGSLNFYNNSTTRDVGLDHLGNGSLGLNSSANAPTGLFVNNNTSGTAAYSAVTVMTANDANHALLLAYTSPLLTPSGDVTANTAYISCQPSCASLTLDTQSAGAPIVFGHNTVEKMRLTNGLCIGCTADPGTGALRLNIYTIATLPSAATAGAGTQVTVSDATTFTPGTCTGGGSDYMIAISNGTTWSCH
jgi:hypothetical protein